MRYVSFWRAQTVFLARLYRSRLVTVAAIRGSCPAGGCITALCCDYRLMSHSEEGQPQPSIGLNEVALGIAVPAYWARVMANTAGFHTAERLLATGQLVDVRTAVALGLVDDCCAKERLMELAEAEMQRRLALPDTGRVATKAQMRGALAREWESAADAEADSGWAMLSDEKVVATLGRVLQRLSGGKGQGKQRTGKQSGDDARQTSKL